MGGKSGGGGTPPAQQVTTTTSNLPEYAEPYFRRALERTIYESARPYQTYTGSRMADFTPEERMSMQGMTNMAGAGTPYQMREASDIASGIGHQPDYQGLSMAREFQPQDISSQYAAPDIDPGFAPGTLADAETLQRYTSPYQQLVTDVEKREATRQSQMAGSQLEQQAAGSGGLGGYREAIMQGERERNLGQQLGDIQTRGSQAGFAQAQQAFEADRSARQQAATMGMSAQEIEDRGRLAANQASMGAAQFNIGQQRAGAELGLRGLGFDQATRDQQLRAGAQLGGLGAQDQEMAYTRLRNMQAAGEMQRNLQQKGLGMQYQDFLRQQAFPREQLGMFNQMLRGLPITPGSSTATYGGPGSAERLLGTGIAGVGLYRGLGG